ncbi:MAG: response regulator [Alphaproteobacteria bacterium]|nr:response regulator [Alphaproteobacteria bacterium]
MTAPAANTTKKRLLVVDDELGFREFIQEAAAGLNIEVACAPDGERAREIYASFKPDVILLDIVMPGVDGVEFTRWLAAEKSDGARRSGDRLQSALCGSHGSARRGARDYVGQISDQTASPRHLGRDFKRLSGLPGEGKIVKLRRHRSTKARFED